MTCRDGRWSAVRATYVALAFLIASLGTRASFAQTYTFSQAAAGTYSWNTAANWGGVAFPNAISDVADLGGNTAASKTVELNQAITVGTINFLGTDSYTIAPGTGGSLILNQSVTTDTAIITMGVGVGNQFITAPIVVTDDNLSITQNSTLTGLTLGDIRISTAHTFSAAGPGTITINGLTVSNTGVIGTLTFSNATGNVRILGAVGHLDPTRNVALTFSGAGTTTIDGPLNLSITPAFGGGTLSAVGGSIVLNDTAKVGAASVSGTGTSLVMNGSNNTFTSLVFSAGTSIDINGTGNYGSVVGTGTGSSSIININAASTFSSLQSGTNSVLFMNNNNITWSTVTLTGGGTLRLGNGVTTGTGSLVSINAANAGKTISAIGNATLAATISHGHTAAGGFVLRVDDIAHTLTITGAISGTGTASMSKTGSGTVVFTGTNNLVTATTVVNGGTLRLLSAGGGTYSFSSIAAGAQLIVDSVTTNSGGITVTGTLQINNLMTFTTGGITLTTTGGTLELGNGVTQAAALTFGASGVAKTLSAIGTAATQSGNISILSTTVNAQLNAGASQTLSLTGIVTGGGFTKTGSGTVVLTNAANTFTGAINLLSGTLRSTATGALGVGNTLTMANVAPVSAGQTVTLDLGTSSQTFSSITIYGTTATNGVSARIAGSGTVTLGGNVTVGSTGAFVGAATISPNINLGAGARTFSVVDSGDTAVGADLVVNGIITGSGSIAKAGTGYLLLNNTASTFSGGLSLGTGAGIVEIKQFGNTGGAGSLGTAANIQLGANSTLMYSGAGETTNRNFYLPTASTSGGHFLIVNAAGLTTFTGAMEGASGSQAWLVLGGSSDAIYTGAIGSGVDIGFGVDANVLGALSKIGTGTWTITNRGAAFGASVDLTISGGKFVYAATPGGFTNANVDAQGTTITLDAATGFSLSGALRFTGNGSASHGIVTSSGGSTLTVVGGITYDATNNPGTATISVGTLSLQSAQNLTVGDSSNTSIELRITSTIAGNSSFNKVGEGTLELSGANGQQITTISGGTLRLDYSTNTASKLLAGNLTTILAPSTSNGVRLELVGATTAVTEDWGHISLLAGQSVISVQGGTADTTLSLRNITSGTGALLKFETNSLGHITTTFAGSALGGWARFNDGWATLSGTGTKTIDINNFTDQNNVGLWTNAHISNAGGGYTGTTSGSLTISSLRFNVAANSTVAIGSADTLTIANGGILVTSAVGSNNSTITGGVISAGASSIYLYNESAGTLTIASNLTSSGNLNKSGVGTVVLAGTNTYTGLTIVEQGTLRVEGGSAIVDTSTLSILSGATFEVGSGSETIGGFTLTTGSLINVASGGGLRTPFPTISVGTINIAAGATLTVNQTTGATVSNSFMVSGDSGSLFVKEGSGILTMISRWDDFEGEVLVKEGTLYLGQASAAYGTMPFASKFTVDSGATLSISAGAGQTDRINNTVVLAGGNLEAINSDNHTRLEDFSVLRVIGSGSVAVRATSTIASNFTISTLIRDNNAVLVIRGSNLGNTGSASINGGRVVVNSLPVDSPLVGGGGAAGTTTVSILPWAIGRTSSNSTLATANAFLTYDTRTSSFDSPALTAPNGFRTLTAAETVAYGSATTNENATLSGTGIVSLDSRTINSLVLDSSASSFTASGSGTLTVNSGGILFTTTVAANSITLGGFTTIVPGATYSQHYLHVYPTTVTIESILANSSGGMSDVIKAGTGTLVLTAANSYTGDTYVQDGVLRLAGGNNRLSITGALYLAAGATPAQFDLAGNSQQLAGIYATHSLASIISSTGTPTLTINVGTGINDTYSGVLAANSFNLVKNGAGALYLAGANTSYTGSTTVNGGLLSISGNWAGTSGVQVAGGTFSANGTIQRSVNVSGGAISLSSGAVLNHASGMAITGAGGLWTGSGSVTGAITQSSGTFQVTSGATLNNLAGYSLTSGTLLANGTISGNVTVDGGTLGGNGTISGNVIVNSGDLSPGNSPGLLTLGDLAMNGGNYVWELASLTTSGAGTNFDFVLVTSGDADLSNTANVVLDFSLLPSLDQPGPDNAFWLTDQQWTILSVIGGGAVNGTFADLNEFVDLGVYGSGLFSLAYDSTNVYLNYNFTAVPEPASLLLASLGALALGGLGWRKRRGSQVPKVHD